MGEIINVFRRMMAACCTIAADAWMPDPAATPADHARKPPPPVIGEGCVTESAETFLAKLDVYHDDDQDEACDMFHCRSCWIKANDLTDEVLETPEDA